MLTQENGGTTAARCNGVAHAKGEWIYFVDSDDCLDPQALSSLTNLIDDDTDLIIGAAAKEGEITTNQYLSSLLCDGLFSTGPVSKLYRKRLFNDLFIFDIPRQIVRGEDLLMLIRLAWQINGKIKLTKSNHYNYRVHDGQVTKTFFTTSSFESEFYEHLTASMPNELMEDYMECLIKNRISAVELIQLGLFKTNDREYKKSEWFKELRRDMVNTKYRTTLWEFIILNLSGAYSIRPLRKIKCNLSRLLRK